MVPVEAKKLMSPSDILDSGVVPIEDGALEEMDGPSLHNKPSCFAFQFAGLSSCRNCQRKFS